MICDTIRLDAGGVGFTGGQRLCSEEQTEKSIDQFMAGCKGETSLLEGGRSDGKNQIREFGSLGVNVALGWLAGRGVRWIYRLQ
jgi:hypothetical protein